MAKLKHWLKKSEPAAKEAKLQPSAIPAAEKLFAEGIRIVEEAEATLQDPTLGSVIREQLAKVVRSCKGLISEFQTYHMDRWLDSCSERWLLLTKKIDDLEDEQKERSQHLPGPDFLRLMREVKAIGKEASRLREFLSEFNRYPTSCSLLTDGLLALEAGAAAAKEAVEAAARQCANAWKAKLEALPEEPEPDSSPSVPGFLEYEWPEGTPPDPVARAETILAELEDLVDHLLEVEVLKEQIKKTKEQRG